MVYGIVWSWNDNGNENHKNTQWKWDSIQLIIYSNSSCTNSTSNNTPHRSSVHDDRVHSGIKRQNCTSIKYNNWLLQCECNNENSATHKHSFNSKWEALQRFNKFNPHKTKQFHFFCTFYEDVYIAWIFFTSSSFCCYCLNGHGFYLNFLPRKPLGKIGEDIKIAQWVCSLSASSLSSLSITK